MNEAWRLSTPEGIDLSLARCRMGDRFIVAYPDLEHFACGGEVALRAVIGSDAEALGYFQASRCDDSLEAIEKFRAVSRTIDHT